MGDTSGPVPDTHYSLWHHETVWQNTAVSTALGPGDQWLALYGIGGKSRSTSLSPSLSRPSRHVSHTWRAVWRHSGAVT